VATRRLRNSLFRDQHHHRDEGAPTEVRPYNTLQGQVNDKNDETLVAGNHDPRRQLFPFN
jgi:hypothetical protein